MFLPASSTEKSPPHDAGANRPGSRALAKQYEETGVDKILQIFDNDRERCYKIISYLLGPDKAKRIRAFADQIVDFLI